MSCRNDIDGRTNDLRDRSKIADGMNESFLYVNVNISKLATLTNSGSRLFY